MTEPYYYFRFKLWKRVDIRGTWRELEESFQVKSLRVHRGGKDIDLSPFEREAAPFTNKDLELRKVLFEMYPRDIPALCRCSTWLSPSLRLLTSHQRHM